MSVPPQPGQPYGTPPGGQPGYPGAQPAAAGPYGAPPAGQNPYGPSPGMPPGQPGMPPGQPGMPQGQPGMPPGQPGMPQGQPFGPPPGQPVSQRKNFTWLRVTIAVVAVIGLAIAGVFYFTKSPDSASAGDCLTIKDFSRGGDTPTKVDCNDPSANVKVALRLDSASASCPGDDVYDHYSVTGKHSYKLCLMINAKQGDCFSNITSSTKGYQRVACTDPTAEAEFVKVVDGTASESACDGTDADGTIIYPQPPTTLCGKKKNNSST